jgi:colicin import membrane protein
LKSSATPYRVPPEPGRWRAIALALLVHGMLLVFLWIGVSWQSVTPVAIEAEIWNPEPREAAPPPPPAPEPEPIPEPVAPKAKAVIPAVVPPKVDSSDAEIALKKEKQQKKREKEIAADLKKEKLAEEKLQRQAADLERKKLAAELEKKKRAEEEQRKQLLAEEEKKKVAEEQKRKQEEALAIQRAQARREEDMKRLNNQAGTGEAEKSQGSKADPGYARMVGARIKSNTIHPPVNDTPGNPAVEFSIELLPDGSLREIRLLKSSGIAAFDQAVRRAIDRSAPYPVDPASGKVPSSFILLHRPKDN